MLIRALLIAATVAVPSVAIAQDESFQAIAGNSANDIWVFGTRNALRWNGTAWSPMPLPPNPQGGAFIAAWAGAPDNVWVVGERGRVLHWDGASWTARPVTIGGVNWTNEMVGVAGFAANDVYVAAQSPSSDAAPVLARWDGTAWSSVLTAPLPFRVARGGLAAQGGELLLAGHILFDPNMNECGLHPLMGAQPCIKQTGVIARLTGEQWTVTASGHSATGGPGWTGLYHNGRSLLLTGITLRVDEGTASTGRYRILSPIDALSVGSFVTPVRGRPAAESGFVRWADAAGPDTTAMIAAAGVFDAGVVIAALRSSNIATRRLGRWTFVPVEGATGVALSRAIGVWGSSAAEAWFVSSTAIVRVAGGREATLAVTAQCIALGARASVTEGCEMYDPTVERPRGLPTRRPGS